MSLAACRSSLQLLKTTRRLADYQSTDLGRFEIDQNSDCPTPFAGITAAMGPRLTDRECALACASIIGWQIGRDHAWTSLCRPAWTKPDR
jgi:hypothetical protein